MCQALSRMGSSSVCPLWVGRNAVGVGGITQGVLHLLGGLAHTNPFAIGPERHPQ